MDSRVHAVESRVRFFDTQFDDRGFILNVLTSLTASNSHDPDDQIKELSSKYDLDFRKRVTDIVLKDLKRSVVTHEAMNLALSGYVHDLELKQQASNFREELQLSQKNFVDCKTLETAITQFGIDVSDLTTCTNTLTEDTESLNRIVAQLQTNVTGI